jgi:hypothetical protein
MMDRRPELGEDASLKLLATTEAPVGNQICKLHITIKVMTFPGANNNNML